MNDIIDSDILTTVMMSMHQLRRRHYRQSPTQTHLLDHQNVACGLFAALARPVETVDLSSPRFPRQRSLHKLTAILYNDIKRDCQKPCPKFAVIMSRVRRNSPSEKCTNNCKMHQ